MLGLLHEERHKRERTLSFVKHHEIVFRFVYPHLIFVPQAEPPEHLEYSFDVLALTILHDTARGLATTVAPCCPERCSGCPGCP